MGLFTDGFKELKKASESRKIHSIIVTLMVKSYQMSKDV